LPDIEAFVEWPGVRGAVAEEGNSDAFVAVHLGG
jgi:hypothetical protein